MRKNTILNQVLQLFSRYEFKKCTNRYFGDHYVKKMDCWQLLTILLYAQGKGLKSLRDINSSLSNYQNRWYHLGLKSVARSTLSDAMNLRSSEIFEDFFYAFLGKCQSLSPNHRFRFKNPLYAMDSTTISLCLSMFPWAKFRRRKGALKIHTLLDHQGCLPSFISISDGRCHDINIVKQPQHNFPALEPDSIIVIDKAYIDYQWLFSLEKQGVFFVTRAKENIKCRTTGQQKANRRKGVVFDRSIRLTNYYQSDYYPKPLRLIKYYDKKEKRHFEFLTNNFRFAASTIAEIYKARWTVETFYRWIKQNLKIKTFLGTSKNAVMTQVWIAMIYYLMLAFIKFQTKYSFSMLDLTRTIRDLILEPISLIEVLRIKFDQFYKTIKPETIQLSFL